MFSKILLATSALAFVASVAAAQTAPNISTTEISTAGLTTGSGLQNMPSNTYIKNDGATLLVIRTSGTTVTATLVTQASTIQKEGFGSETLTNKTVSIPANSVAIIGPFPQSRWNNASGLVQVSMSAVTGVSATSIKVQK